MPIRAIFYDLDGTLRASHPAGRQVFADYVSGLGLVITPDARRRAALWEHRYWASSPELRADVQAYPEEKAFWAHYSYRQLLAVGASAQQAGDLSPQVGAYMDQAYRPDDVLFDGLVETLASLRASGISLGVISNRSQPFQDYLRELGIGDYFGYTLAAGEVNSWKPDRGIFLHALRETGMQASETIYVGDNYFADVLGARSAGIHPVLIDPDGLFEAPDCPVIQAHAELISYLERRNVWPGSEK